MRVTSLEPGRRPLPTRCRARHAARRRARARSPSSATTARARPLAVAGDTEAVPIGGAAKLVTLLVTLDSLPLPADGGGPDDPASAPRTTPTTCATSGEGSRTLPVSPGETWTERDVVRAVLLASSNNHADTLVRWAFGGVDAYVEARERLARRERLHRDSRRRRDRTLGRQRRHRRGARPPRRHRPRRPRTRRDAGRAPATRPPRRPQRARPRRPRRATAACARSPAASPTRPASASSSRRAARRRGRRGRPAPHHRRDAAHARLRDARRRRSPTAVSRPPRHPRRSRSSPRERPTPASRHAWGDTADLDRVGRVERMPRGAAHSARHPSPSSEFTTAPEGRDVGRVSVSRPRTARSPHHSSSRATSATRARSGGSTHPAALIGAFSPVSED